MEASGDNLVEKAAGGDRDALVELFKRDGPAVRRGLTGRIPQHWQGVLSEDDVMQQTYATAAGGMHEFHSGSESSFAKWLTTVARRNLGDAIKMLEADKRGGDRRLIELKSTDDTYVTLWDLLTGAGTTPSQHVARGEAKTALERAIDQLPEDYARVVVMYDLEGRPVQEVADALQRSAGLKVRIPPDRARRQSTVVAEHAEEGKPCHCENRLSFEVLSSR